ncbi:Fic family protein [Brevundimonas denitrificans]|uniref:Fic family protein n=1 Tax=Brevundimonas denitrificans TaxID=1443434 RepID=UPI00223AD31A|nr:Fic family protein [Brevundimonas denitrificans]
MDELPLSQRLIKRTHEVLMQGVRGRNKDPGEYRRIPNWIGPEGCAVETARFVPVGADQLAEAMDAWEAYLHAEAPAIPDKLVQLAVLHAEFEAIHPFLDGNGRLGRLIVPLFLFSEGLLTRPNFYLSEYLESHRDEYYDRLLAISRDGDWTGWCEFFLRGLITQAETNQTKRPRSWTFTGSGRTGSPTSPIRNMRFARWTGCFRVRSSSPLTSWKAPIFPAPRRPASCVSCVTTGYCGKCVPPLAAGRRCSPSPNSSISPRGVRRFEDHPRYTTRLVSHKK